MNSSISKAQVRSHTNEEGTKLSNFERILLLLPLAGGVVFGALPFLFGGAFGKALGFVFGFDASFFAGLGFGFRF